MEQVTENAVAEKAVAAPVEIIRGRMPVAIVALVRFGNNKGGTTKELATMFGTTVGKIDDIKKNRNFAYVTADFKPTQEQKDAGIAWLKTHPKYDECNVDSLAIELDATPVATAEEAAAFDAARAAARGQSDTTKTGEKADGGGGNRRSSKKAATETAAPTAESLMD
jgi:hypothetical protein